MGKRIRYKDNDLRQLAMLMLAEARGEGPIGMEMVGTVSVNRVNANCQGSTGHRCQSAIDRVGDV